jgi:hypothetical protein
VPGQQDQEHGRGHRQTSVVISRQRCSLASAAR